MITLRGLLRFGFAGLVLGCMVQAGHAETFSVSPGQDIQSIADRAVAGDTILLEAGEHRGDVIIGKQLTLAGKPGAVLTGTGRGHVVEVKAGNSIVRGLTIRGSGNDLVTLDSGVFVAKTAGGTIVEGNRLEGNLHGIYLHGAPDSIARNNVVIGRTNGRMNDFGSGVSVWNAHGAKVLGNDISLGRDGIYVNTSKRNIFSGNRMRNTRFAIHYMYADDSEVSDNISLDNTIGYAIMFSRSLIIRHNYSRGDRDHGLLLNYANYSTITDNLIIGGVQPAERWQSLGVQEASEHGMPVSERGAGEAGDRIGPEKCVFIYNANRNGFSGNRFEGCEIGIHFTAGSEGNRITGNAFINNRNQVKYVGTRYLDWSVDGRGNYWSDNPAFDLDGDGIADTAYRPNGLVDRVLWVAPQAKVLMNSPAVQVIRWAQAQFPAILPGGVIDSKPLMAPPLQPQFNLESPVKGMM